MQGLELNVRRGALSTNCTVFHSTMFVLAALPCGLDTPRRLDGGPRLIMVLHPHLRRRMGHWCGLQHPSHVLQLEHRLLMVHRPNRFLFQDV